MTNVDKAFYLQAAYELAQSQLDHALRIKVRAENPNSDDKAVQALYVQARAAELATARGLDIIKRIGTGAVTKTRRTIDELLEAVRWALKWSLHHVPLSGQVLATLEQQVARCLS